MPQFKKKESIEMIIMEEDEVKPFKVQKMDFTQLENKEEKEFDAKLFQGKLKDLLYVAFTKTEKEFDFDK